MYFARREEKSGVSTPSYKRKFKPLFKTRPAPSNSLGSSCRCVVDSPGPGPLKPKRTAILMNVDDDKNDEESSPPTSPNKVIGGSHVRFLTFLELFIEIK